MTQKIKKVAVIGTGLLGTQIAMISVHAGYKVTVYDTVASAFKLDRPPKPEDVYTDKFIPPQSERTMKF